MLIDSNWAGLSAHTEKEISVSRNPTTKATVMSF